MRRTDVGICGTALKQTQGNKLLNLPDEFLGLPADWPGCGGHVELYGLHPNQIRTILKSRPGSLFNVHIRNKKRKDSA